jgi:hypothetical protein
MDEELWDDLFSFWGYVIRNAMPWNAFLVRYRTYSAAVTILLCYVSPWYELVIFLLLRRLLARPKKHVAFLPARLKTFPCSTMYKKQSVKCSEPATKFTKLFRRAHAAITFD